jgi:pimeloyl-ACP methyl ester carboxylesterase
MSHGSDMRTDVEFLSGGVTCRAWFYRAQIKVEKTPCIVLAHGFGGTRDAGLEPYAEHFCQAGFHVLLFDYRYFGASDGEPRQLLSVKAQLQDWQAAINYARKCEGVDSDRIGLWGTSFSGGHVVVVAAKDGRIAAVSSQGLLADGFAVVDNIVKRHGVKQLLQLTVCGLYDQLRAWLQMSPFRLRVASVGDQLCFLNIPDEYDDYLAILPENFTYEVCARIALTLGLYRPIKFAPQVKCPVMLLICTHDSLAPAAPAFELGRRLGGPVNVVSAPEGHFEIYRGDAFERYVVRQTEFFEQSLCLQTAEV